MACLARPAVMTHQPLPAPVTTGRHGYHPPRPTTGFSDHWKIVSFGPQANHDPSAGPSRGRGFRRGCKTSHRHICFYSTRPAHGSDLLGMFKCVTFRRPFARCSSPDRAPCLQPFGTRLINLCTLSQSTLNFRTSSLVPGGGGTKPCCPQVSPQVAING